jgi:hypothetical protein
MATSDRPSASDVKVFVPTRDLDVSKRYYEAVGWRCNWRVEGLAEIELSGHRLCLQRFYAKEWADNFMIYVDVDDADAWFAHLKRIVDSGEFEGVAVKPPKLEDYGAKVTYAYDPCGVLLHFAQALGREGDSS